MELALHLLAMYLEKLESQNNEGELTMKTYTATPDFYRDYIAHYNHNHDPRNGQFASGNSTGGNVRGRYFARKFWLSDGNAEEKLEGYLRDLDRQGIKYHVENVRDMITGDIFSYDVYEYKDHKSKPSWGRR